MVKYCTNCGASLPEDSKFCVKCGAKATNNQQQNLQANQTSPQQSYSPPKTTPVQPNPTPPPIKSQMRKSNPSSGNLKKIGAIVVVAILVVAALYVAFMFMGDEGDDDGTGDGQSQTENYGILMGRVKDTSNSAIGDVIVTASGKTAETNDQGWFSISNVTEGDRVLVGFSKEGYAPTYRVVDVTSGESNFIETTMSTVDTTQTFRGDTGGTVSTTSGGNLDIEQNTLVDSQNNVYSGLVDVSLTVFDSTDENDADAFPGEFLGVDSTGEEVPLKSYGFMDISIADSMGNDLQLADGETADIEIPVPDSMQSEASSMVNCPLWYFDTDTGMWQQEGQGTYDSTSGTFSASVSHFSTWNFDVAYPRAFISGRVVNSTGAPVAGANVRCWGAGWSYARWESGETGTADDGTFTRIPVECTVIFQYRASKGGYSSDDYTIPRALDCGEEYDVGDIVLGSVANTQITLTWGENPRDLDSHLTIPEYNGNGPYHVYYSDKDFSQANLDTDDTSSYGPEVVTIFDFHPGTYRYSVRHYAGTGNIETSGAEINVIIQGEGIYKFTPPSGQEDGTDIWQVFDIVIDSSGKIKIDEIGDYVTGGDESELLYAT